MAETAPGHSIGLEDLSTQTTRTDARSEATGTDAELPPMDRGRKAWLFVASACSLETIIWGYSFSFGVFQDYLHTHEFPSSSLVSISAIGTVALALQYSSLLFLFNIYRRYPEIVLPCTYIAVAVCVLALLLSSFATQIWQLILLQGVIYGAGAGVIYAPAVIWLYEWYSVRRGLAGGIIFAGTGIGGFAFPLILGAMLEKVGYAWTMRIWALFTAVASSLSMFGLKPRLPLPPKGAPRAQLIPRNMTFWRDPVFISVIATNFLQSLAYLSVSLYLSVFTTSLGYAPIYGQIALAIFNIAGVAGQIGVGWICDSRPYTFVMAISAFASAVCAFLLWGYASSVALVFVFACLFGSISGGFTSTWPTAATDIAGNQPQQAGLIFSLFAVSKAVSAVAGPSIAGSLYDPTTARSAYGGFGFAKMELFVGSTMLVTCLGSLATQAARTKRQ